MDAIQQTFPFRTVLSLEPLIDRWRELAKSEQASVRTFAVNVLQRVESVSALRGVIEDLRTIEEHRDVVDLLLSFVFPFGMASNVYAAAVIPFEPISFYTTKGFEDLNLIYHLINHFDEQGAYMSHGKAVKGYMYALESLYGKTVPFTYPLFLPVHNQHTGLTRYFKLDFDSRFVKLVRNGPVPDLKDDEIEALLADRMNLDLWQQKLPSENLEYHGFAVLTMVEVTEGQIVSALKNDLLQKDALNSPEKIDQIQHRIRSMLKESALDIGLILIQRGEFDKITSIKPLGRSLLLSKGVAPNCPMWSQSLYAGVTHGYCEPVLIPDLQKEGRRTGFEEYVMNQGYRSLLLAPLYSGDKLVGILEVASPQPNSLDAFAVAQLKEITSLFGVAISRGVEEQEDRIQAIIKEQYTSIHPTVEWRFREAAQKYLQEEIEGQLPSVDSIVFQDVYPLYGLSDIRGSSDERNTAIQADLVTQLTLGHAILIEAQKVEPLHILDELSYRIGEYTAELEEELRSGDEIGILHFLRDDVESLFDELSHFGPEVKAAIDRYNNALDPDLKVLYSRRKAYEESVRQINDTIGTYIEKQEVEAQRMYPHFFEMYKTDGVDYNLYVGASLVENRSYDPLYLRNLRLWQLMTMCGVEWELDALYPGLQVPLRTAHLILVQDLPLSIRFRIDEKKFDVDGAYNIRYEIVKKRIDKARIIGSGERLTQPGKIAIVYSQPKEAEEYRRYIKYLKAAGYLTDQLEEVELENLQGVHGLKALRVTMKARPDFMHEAAAVDFFKSPLGDGASVNAEGLVEFDAGAEVQ